jgi:hypothetical protein
MGTVNPLEAGIHSASLFFLFLFSIVTDCHELSLRPYE